MKKIANILLGGWLVLTGLISLADFGFRGSSIVRAVLAIVAGLLLILADRSEKFSGHIADFILGIWLILVGLVPLINMHFRGSAQVLDVIAIAAGVLTIIRRK